MISRRGAPSSSRELWRELAVALGPVVAVGLALRLYGLDFGRGYHPDERHMIGVVIDMKWPSLNPNSFAYGSFPYYCLYFLQALLAPIFGSNYDNGFLRGRALSALVGTAGLGATYWLARLMEAPRQVAWWASVLLGLTFFHVQNSHFFTVDIWLTTAITFGLITLVRFYEEETKKRALIAGATLGVALAIKISALSLMMPAAILVLGNRFLKEDFRKARAWAPTAWFLLAVAGTFALCEPYALLNAARVWSELREQMDMASGAAIRPFTMQYLHTPFWIYPLEQIVFYTIGWPLAVAGFLGTGWAILRQCRNQFKNFDLRKAAVLGWMVAFFFAIGAQHTKFPRYLLPLYPLLAIGAAQILAELEGVLRARFGELPIPGWWLRVPRGFVVAYTAIFTFAHLAPFSQPHVWHTASRWLYQQYPAQTKTAHEPWDDTLPLGFGDKRFTSVGTLPLYEPETPARLEQILDILTHAEIMALPTARVYGSILQAPEERPQTARYYRLLFSGKLGWERLRVFKIRPRFGPWEWNEDLADESLSVYTNPKVVIFGNRERLTVDELRRRLASAPDDQTCTRENVMTIGEPWE